MTCLPDYQLCSLLDGGGGAASVFWASLSVTNLISQKPVNKGEQILWRRSQPA